MMSLIRGLHTPGAGQINGEKMQNTEMFSCLSNKLLSEQDVDLCCLQPPSSDLLLTELGGTSGNKEGPPGAFVHTCR